MLYRPHLNLILELDVDYSVLYLAFISSSFGVTEEKQFFSGPHSFFGMFLLLLGGTHLYILLIKFAVRLVIRFRDVLVISLNHMHILTERTIGFLILETAWKFST